MDMMIAYHLISSQTKIDPIMAIIEYSKLEPKDFKATFGKVNVELITAQDFSKYLSDISTGILAIYDELNYLLKKEDLYKIYGESYKGDKGLIALLTAGEEIVTSALSDEV